MNQIDLGIFHHKVSLNNMQGDSELLEIALCLYRTRLDNFKREYNA